MWPFISYLFVDFRCGLGITERNCCNILQDRHLDGAVAAIEEGHEGAGLDGAIGDGAAGDFNSLSFCQHFSFVHR